MKTRYATKVDLVVFGEWLKTDKGIPVKDFEDAVRNRTTVVLVTTDDDGKVILYSAMYCVLMDGFNGWNPDTTLREKAAAAAQQIEAFKAFAGQHGIDDVLTFRVDDCVLANFAEKHGFEKETRTAIILKGEGKNKKE